MIVIDASAMLEMLLQTPGRKAVEDRIFAPGQTLHAPHLLDIEVTQVLRRYVARGQLDPAAAALAVADLIDFPMRRYAHDPLLSRVWDLRDNMTAYDAVYVALAEALDAPLITRDRRLAAAPGHEARIDVI